MKIFLLTLMLVLSGCVNTTAQKPKRIAKVNIHDKQDEKYKEMSLEEIGKFLEDDLKHPKKIKSKKAQEFNTIEISFYKGIIKNQLIKPKTIKLQQNEVQNICFTFEDKKTAGCYWIGLEGNNLYINLNPDLEKIYKGRYKEVEYEKIIDKDTYTVKIKKKSFFKITIVPINRGLGAYLELYVQ